MMQRGIIILLLLLVSRSDSHAIQRISLHKRFQKDIDLASTFCGVQSMPREKQSAEHEDLHYEDDDDLMVTIHRMRIKDVSRVTAMIISCSIEQSHGICNCDIAWKELSFPYNLRMRVFVKILSVGLHCKILPSVMFDHTMFVASCTGSLGSETNGIVGMVAISQENVNNQQPTNVLPMPTLWKRMHSRFCNNKLYRPYISCLYVDPFARGHRVGKQLLQTAEDYAVHAWKSPTVYLHCNMKPTINGSPSPALCMYHDYGYQPMMMMMAVNANSADKKSKLEPVGWERYSEAIFQSHQVPMLYLEKKFNQFPVAEAR